ncbi:conserved protein of unknown function [Mesotoga infera]|uniref:Glycosyltransferase subfamily 4-like N-terminal domain-containing protein n=1 Tax=Mesotoga infera TaxID=1236046 RepID=A0A7Z7LDN0_9BACT|nr:hypothetical protein [Mesotoga infera]SSC12129.1 conserved protein of unknown function [Mesotoga infera]
MIAEESVRECLNDTLDVMKPMEKRDNYRTLIISHNSLSSGSSNGRTLEGFFWCWRKDSLAQIFFASEIPDTDVCSKFFRVTDMEVLKATIFSEDAGKEIECSSGSQTRKSSSSRIEKVLHTFGKKKTSIGYIARNLIWRLGSKRLSLLNRWIDLFDPEVVLYQAGDYVFSLKIALDVSRRKGIPLIIYNSEDYFLKKRFSLNPCYWMNRKAFVRVFREAIENASYVIYSCELLKEDFDDFFETPSEVIYTSSRIEPTFRKKDNTHFRISFIGNLGNRRHVPLIDFCEELVKIDPRLYVDVYSKTSIDLNRFDSKGLKFHGSIGYQQVQEVIAQSDFLLHVEDFSKTTKRDLRHAFSTKIADYLSSGKCVIAYGPVQIASIEYLLRNRAALVITEKNEIEPSLKSLLRDVTLQRFLSFNALNLAKKNHNPLANCDRFKSIVDTVIKSDSRKVLSTRSKNLWRE